MLVFRVCIACVVSQTFDDPILLSEVLISFIHRYSDTWKVSDGLYEVFNKVQIAYVLLGLFVCFCGFKKKMGITKIQKIRLLLSQ